MLRARAIMSTLATGGGVRATFEMIFLSVWAPHESQQKPLPPGPAKMRFADVLGIAPDAAS